MAISGGRGEWGRGDTARPRLSPCNSTPAATPSSDVLENSLLPRPLGGGGAWYEMGLRPPAEGRGTCQR